MARRAGWHLRQRTKPSLVVPLQPEVGDVTGSDRGTVYRSALNDAQRGIRDWVYANASSASLRDRLKALNELAYRGPSSLADRRKVKAWFFARQRDGVVRRL